MLKNNIGSQFRIYLDYDVGISSFIGHGTLLVYCRKCLQIVFDLLKSFES